MGLFVGSKGRVCLLLWLGASILLLPSSVGPTTYASPLAPAAEVQPSVSSASQDIGLRDPATPRKTVGEWLATGDHEAAFKAYEEGRGEDLLRRLRQGLDGGFASPSGAPAMASSETARQSLDAGTLLLAYAVEDAATHVFVIDHEKGLLDVRTLPIGKIDLAREVQHFLAAIAGARWEDTQFFDRFQELSRWFYSQLVAPFDNLIEESERLLIVPDGPLHRLPFTCLLRPANGTRDEQYLIEWKALHSVISTEVYAELRSTSPKPIDRQSHLAAFGDAEYGAGRPAGPGASPWATSRSVSLGSRGRLALPGSGRELRAIAAHLPNHRLFLGKDATEANLRSLDSELDILHVSAHGQRPGADHQQASLLLSPRRRGGVVVPGSDRLTVDEILSGRLPRARLVVVSACESALGPDVDDSFHQGLGWAFLATGAQSVITSLWQIDDQRTVDLMDRLYAHLAVGDAPSDALRQAQLESIQSDGLAAAPYFWAAFQLQGDWR